MSVFLVALLLTADAPAEESLQKAPEPTTFELGGTQTTISYQWFLAYSYGERDDEVESVFQINRGYINIKTKLSKYLSTRITPDVTVDQEGDGEGDLKLRLKYAHIKARTPSFWIFTKPTLEFGIAHRPWLDWEEHVNYYRAQGTMFLERIGQFNSADAGLTIMSLIGDEMGEAWEKTADDKYPGRYGSFAVGVYNGGGYHSIEKNLGKSVEWRLSIRPLPDFLPWLQVSYTGAYGSGNIEAAPPWEMHFGYLSWTSRWLVAAGGLYTGRGNSKGTALTERGRARSQRGATAFVELKLHPIKTSVFGRYDYFDPQWAFGSDDQHRVIGGVAYHFFGRFQLVADYDRLMSRDDTLESVGKMTLEVHL